MRTKYIKAMCVAASVAMAMTATQGAEGNLLKNPGFEKPGRAGIPESWSREFNAQLSGPFMTVPDAHTGKAAVCIMTEEWNFMRPQFITQEVPLPPGATVCHLSSWCKGQGLVNLVFQFRKDGKPLETETVDMGFGPTSAPKESRHAFGLEQDYQPYTISAAIPTGAVSVLVKLGNTCELFDRLNVWGKAFIDDAALTADTQSDTPAPSTPVTDTDAVETPAGLVDIAPYARITTQPAAFDIGQLVDGNVQTTCRFLDGLERAATVNLQFHKAFPIHTIQLYLNGGAESFTVRGDTQGQGHYEKLLARGDQITKAGWVTLAAGNTPVRGIRIQALQGKNLYSGFRSTFPFVNEIKILTPSNQAVTAALEAQAVFRRSYPVPPNVPALDLRPGKLPIPPLAKGRFRKMVCADLWMWGVDPATKDAKLTDIRNNPTFKKTVQGVKAMGVTTIEIDLTNASCRDLMPWPSKVANGTGENFLKAVIAALHAEGLQVAVELIHNITPFETIKWHYPQMETSCYPGMKQYPSVIHGTYFRDNWLTIEDEIMACGADGVGLSTDESYYRGAFLPTLPADDPGRKLYRERFGYDLPAKEADTLKFRQWIVMRHEGICDVYGYVSQKLRAKYPNIYLNTMWMQPTADPSHITGIGIPWDLMAARAGITELGSDYMGPYGVRMASAANGWRRATMVYSGNLGGVLPDMHYYGTVLWSWMYGAGSANYWRYNWIEDAPNSREALTRAYRLSDDLEALGAWDAKPPKKIAFLTSRASLDWWQVRSWWGSLFDDPNWDRGLEGQRGWFATEAVFNTLQRNGYAFDWKYLDQPDKLNDLSEFKVLLMPFTYSIGREAAAKVKAAVAKGAQLILLDGRQGETDEWGEPYAVPAFKELVDAGQAMLMKEDILAWGSTDTFAEKIMSAIDGTLGEENPLKLERYGKHVDATVIQKSPREQFLFVLNWEKQPVPVDLGVAVPEGSYQVFVRDENQWSQASIAGRDKLTRKDLRKFRVNLAAEKPYVFYIQESK